MIAVACTLTFIGCKDDVYDPERGIQTNQKENPLGEDFTAPDGFNWSMGNSINLNVSVKDEFSGQYNYLVEVFTNNPLNDPTAVPIAAGIAKGGNDYTTGIHISNATERLYIRQTDPKQRQEIYEYEVPEHGGNLQCKLYYTADAAKAATRADGEAGQAGWDKITKYDYTEETYTVPSESAEISNNQIQS